MNSQIFPGTAESLNRQTHETLLRTSRTARQVRGPRLEAQHKDIDRFPNIDKGYRRPNLLEPAVSFLVIAGLALQVALLAAF
jgi:hypothetical protein